MARISKADLVDTILEMTGEEYTREDLETMTAVDLKVKYDELKAAESGGGAGDGGDNPPDPSPESPPKKKNPKKASYRVKTKYFRTNKAGETVRLEAGDVFEADPKTIPAAFARPT